VVCAVGYDLNDVNDVFRRGHGAKLVNVVNVVNPSFERQSIDDCPTKYRRTEQRLHEF